MSKLRFSGHDTFIVRSYWPKKGYDFVKNGYKFSSEDAEKEGVDLFLKIFKIQQASSNNCITIRN